MTEPEKTPDVLILDEVDNHLDDANRTLLLEYIVKITKLGKQLFVVTHNPFFLFNIMQMNNVAI
ncbi:AAA family ATPase [bacterium]|nr:AAA family ATPase [bacterium]